MPNNNNEKGVYISVDFSTERLKIYYPSHYNNAYRDLKKFLEKNGYEHLKDTNYFGKNITKIDADVLLADFAEENKWFSLCLEKLDFTEVNGRWRAKEAFVDAFTDSSYKQKMENIHNPKTMDDWKAAIAKKRTESLNEHRNVQKSKSLEIERD